MCGLKIFVLNIIFILVMKDGILDIYLIIEFTRYELKINSFKFLID